MIYCKAQNLLFIENPKSASTTIAAILLERLGGERVFSPPLEGAPSWSNGLATHRTEWGSPVPEDVTVFTTIREPLSRAFSIWDHACVRHAGVFGWPDPAHGDPYPFSDFAWWLATAGPKYEFRRKHASPWMEEQTRLFLSQDQLLDGARVDVFVRADRHLAEDLGRVGISADELAWAGRRNQGSRQFPRQATGVDQSFISRWAEGDWHLLRLAEENRSLRASR